MSATPIERAARAVAESTGVRTAATSDHMWVRCMPEGEREIYRDHARTALTAALDRDELARVLGGVALDADWPSNADLGGSGTGTRDDEYRDAMLADADAVIAHLLGGAS